MQRQALLAEKRIDRMTVRLPDTLKRELELSARTSGTTLSDYVVHIAAERSNGQAVACRTLSDEAASLATMLEAAHGDFSDATSLQRLWLIRKMAKVTMMLAGGDR